jgi:hypothetical protein
MYGKFHLKGGQALHLLLDTQTLVNFLWFYRFQKFNRASIFKMSKIFCFLIDICDVIRNQAIDDQLYT